MDTKSYFEPVMALANISGSKEYPTITGRIIFKRKGEGVLVTAEIFNLPYEVGKCKHRIFGFHIHEGSSCTGNDKDPFANAGGHYNPDDCVHPMHAGDIPPLFGNNGYAYLSFYTDRFKIQEVIDKVVIIHDMPDDFKTQPSGVSGKRIACGKIEVV